VPVLLYPAGAPIVNDYLPPERYIYDAHRFFWGMPGGFVRSDKSSLCAASRTLNQLKGETGVISTDIAAGSAESA
jgi:ADP-ribose pyrophosphatase YjhB (NUDIX family)